MLLYLVASFRRCYGRHLSFFTIMTLSFLLPFGFIMLNDSLEYGTQEMYRLYTNNYQNYAIDNSKPEYLEFFHNIDGIAAFYENNRIYIKVDDDILADSFRLFQINTELSAKCEEINDSEVMLVPLTDVGETPFKSIRRGIYFTIVIISLYIIASTYVYHHAAFTNDIKTMCHLGMRKLHLKCMLVTEFIVSFVLAAIVGLVISSTGMWWLIVNFFESRENGTAFWLLYKLDYSNAFFCIAIMFVLSVTVILIIINKKTENIDSNTKTLHYFLTLKSLRNISVAFVVMIFQRTRKQVTSCIFFVYPIITALAAVMMCIFSFAAALDTNLKYEITIHNRAESGFSSTEIDYIKSIDEVDYISPICTEIYGLYMIADQRMKGPDMIIADDIHHVPLRITPYSGLVDIHKNGNINLTGTEIVVNNAHNYLSYEIGDTVVLRTVDFPMQHANIRNDIDNRNGDNKKPIELVIKDTLNLSRDDLDIYINDDLLSVFVSDELYALLTAGYPVNLIRVKLTDSNTHIDTTEVLNRFFSAKVYTVIDNIETLAVNNKRISGLYALALIISFLVLGVISFILFMRLRVYIASQKEIINILSMIGADALTIRTVYSVTPFLISLLCCLISLYSGFRLAGFLCFVTSIEAVVDYRVIISFLTISATLITAFVLPIIISIKQKKEYRDEYYYHT